MALVDHNKSTLQFQPPGYRADVFRHDTGEIIVSGTIAGDGTFSYQYPASLGPSYALVRAPTDTLSPWSATTAVAIGDTIAAPGIAGTLRCVIAGTTGASAPTEAANRLYGQSHRKAASTYTGRCMIMNRAADPAVSWYGDGDLWNNNNYDGNPWHWPGNTILEVAMSYDVLAGLNQDGTLLVQCNNVSTNFTNMYNALKTWTGIVKLWATKYSIFGLKYDGTLQVAHQTTNQGAINTLLSANPTAKYPVEGARDAGYFSLVLADGTLVSNSSEVNGHVADLTGIEYAYQNYRENVAAVGGQGTLGYYRGNGSGDNDKTLVAPDEWLDCFGGTYAITLRSRLGQFITGWESNRRYEDTQIPSALNGLPLSQLGIQGCLFSSSTSNAGMMMWTAHGVGDLMYNRWNEGHRYAWPMDAEQDKLPLTDNKLLLDGSVLYYLEEAETRLHTPTLERTLVEVPASETGQVSGTVTVGGAVAARPVLAISAAQINGQRKLLAEGNSSGVDGSYSLSMPDFTDPIYVVALDEGGHRWAASTAYSVGDRVFATAVNHTGLVYECSQAGATGASEPSWPAQTGVPVNDGAATWVGVAHYQPQAHGPINPEVIGVPDDISENGNTYTYVQQLIVESMVLNEFANPADTSDRIYRRLTPPDDIVSGATYRYARTVNGALWYDEYENTVNSSDRIHRTLSVELLSSRYPIDLQLLNGAFTDGLNHWTASLNNFGLRGANPSAAVGSQYVFAGAYPEARVYQRIAVTDLGLPPEELTGKTLRCRFAQASYSAADQGQLSVRQRDNSLVDIGNAASTLAAINPGLTWTYFNVDQTLLAGSVHVDVELYGYRQSGTNSDAYFDNIKLQIV